MISRLLGRVSAVFSRSSIGTERAPAMWPAAYSAAAPGAGFGSVHLAGAGVAPDNGFAGTASYGGVARWGDYSNGQIIPGTNTLWLATQYIPNNGDGNENWGNRIFELNLG